MTSLVVLGTLGILVGVVEAPAGWSNVVATLVGIALSYELNRRWTWGGRVEGRTPIQIVSFTAMNLAGLGLSTVAVHTVAVIATEHDLTRLLRTAAVELVNIAAWGLLWVIQFLVLDRFVFRDRRRRPRQTRRWQPARLTANTSRSADAFAEADHRRSAPPAAELAAAVDARSCGGAVIAVEAEHEVDLARAEQPLVLLAGS